jgi:hypothetical protein
LPNSHWIPSFKDVENVCRPVQMAALYPDHAFEDGVNIWVMAYARGIGLRLLLGPDNLELLLSIDIIEAGHTIFPFGM